MTSWKDSRSVDAPDLARLSLEDDADVEEEDLFASPSSGATTQKHTPIATTSFANAQQQQQQRNEQQRARSQSETRDTRLRAELERVREVNRVIEGVTASLEKAKANMGTVQRTVESASTLLGTWTRILGQTEHNQRLILNPNWQGATRDVEDIEGDEARRQQEAERRVLDEQRRSDEAQARAEAEERRRAAVTPAGGRGTKTRGTRGSSSRGYTGVGGQAGRGRGAPSTRGSGIGRGANLSGRGLG
ncbi:hypothetical protein LTR53_008021 [Teratosphaeriaceae sp. CCFEE 6253]|nr:hypothetical protein LTR53_008021 [Teratosphaeriaceae sp. CCFEE 6253]